MKIITERDEILNVAKRWKAIYKVERFKNDLDKQVISKQLDELDKETATVDDVIKIIGNNSWTNLKCDDCGKNRLKTVIEVGESPNYESRTARICPECLMKASELLKNKE